MTVFEATREAGLQRLESFLPRAGSRYASTRNFDRGPVDRTNVSVLSPYIRHRLVLEEEVAREVLNRHSLSSAEKFIQEVCWRTYWKGWLEMRPAAWTHYRRRVAELEASLERDASLSGRVERAFGGETGIACFDAWARELRAIGYLHNHTRMWFASIWIFTLGLPWELGAAFFLRHLHDGDPASNTLSWRWVAGLHTSGKTYLARASNIATYTDGRFTPSAGDLSPTAPPVKEEAQGFERHAIPVAARIEEPLDCVLLITEEDCCPESLPLGAATIRGIVIADPASLYARHAPAVVGFKSAALQDAAKRAAEYFQCEPVTAPIECLASVLADTGARVNSKAVVTATIPVGPTRDAVLSAFKNEPPILEVRREWDTLFWPHATSGFFKLKDKIPKVLSQILA